MPVQFLAKKVLVISVANQSNRKPTHSVEKTPSLHNGPSNETRSKTGAVAFWGIHSGILVIMTAMLLIDTKTSSPPTTPRQIASPPPRPSGLKSDSWKSNSRTTGPRIPSISLSGSKRRAMSCRNCSTSEGDRVFGLDKGLERRGAERAERERSGCTSSGGPRGRLRLSKLIEIFEVSLLTLMVGETYLAPAGRTQRN